MVPDPKPGLAQVFGIDPRSLAAWRIGAGILLLADLALRARDLTAHYTDAGVLPRALVDPWYRETVFAAYFWGGGTVYVGFLFACAAICAALMVLGAWTRVATLGSWALLTALQMRNPHVLNFGDEIIRLMLFWSVFLPLGCSWSVDASRRGSTEIGREPLLSVATTAALLQLWVIYIVGALLKTGPDWHENATAVYYSLQQDWLAKPAGLYLRQYPLAMEWLTRATLWFECLGPFLLFTPARFAKLRTAAVGLFCLFHLSLGISLELGIFPYFMVAALALFLPSWFWDRIALVPRLPRPRPGMPSGRRIGVAVRETLATFFLLYVVIDSVSDVRGRSLPPFWERAGELFRIQQDWAMFAPNVPRRDGWFVMPGTLADGRIVGLPDGASGIDWEKPPLVSATPGSSRWRHYLILLQAPSWHPQRHRYADWLCRRWNGSHPGPDRLTRVEIWFIDETTPPAYDPPVAQPRLLLDRPCPPDGPGAHSGLSMPSSLSFL